MSALLPIKVLLVEDNESDYLFTQQLIEDINSSQPETAGKFELTRCANLAQAVERVSTENFSIVLLDLSLPDSFGIETFNIMRAVVPHLPIVVFSGNQDQATALQAVEAGAQDYLVKGRIDEQLLFRSVNYSIQRFRSLRQLENALARTRRLMHSRAEFINHVDSAISKQFENVLDHIPESAKQELRFPVLTARAVVQSVLEHLRLFDEDGIRTDEVFKLEPAIADVVESLTVYTQARAMSASYLLAENLPETIAGDPKLFRNGLEALLLGAVLVSSPKSSLEFVVERESNDHDKIKFKVVISRNRETQDIRALLFESIMQGPEAATVKFGVVGLLVSLAAKAALSMHGETRVHCPDDERVEIWMQFQDSRMPPGLNKKSQ